MQYESKSSFDRVFKKLSPKDKEEVITAIETLIDVMERKTTPSQGLGMKRIGKNYWEVRVGLELRILCEVSDKLILFFVGNHDEVKRFIRN